MYIESSSILFHGLIAHFVLALSNILLSDVTQLLDPSPTEGQLGCFQVWAIMNKAAANIRVQVFVWMIARVLLGRRAFHTEARLKSQSLFHWQEFRV